jgi:hypothetical protein
MKWLCIIILLTTSCTMKTNNSEITTSASGHTLHHNGVFSPDGEWIVYDGRNDDTKIGETSTIGMVNVHTGEEKILYKTSNQTLFGPGVGAVTFSPKEEKIIFIHGLPSANEEKPYAISRRTGVGIDVKNANVPFFYDARDVVAPYTNGSLRGGTHSHCWSADGSMISFTYNDELVDADLRVVGVMFPSKDKITVEAAEGNNEGSMHSAIVTEVVRNPEPGSDQINKAFDECWVNGYTNAAGEKISHAIAFQGNVINKDGKVITEAFIVDVDPETILADTDAVGAEGERPKVPSGIRQRRITFSEKGISDTRHWLRASPDGVYIYALAKDHQNFNQVVQIEINSGKMEYISDNTHSIDFSFNLSTDGKQICYVAANGVYVFDIAKKTSVLLTQKDSEGKIIGAPSFSPKGDFIVYNQYMKHADGQEYLQIRKVKLKN